MELNEKEARTRLIANISSCREIAYYDRAPYLIHPHEILVDTFDHSLLRLTDIKLKVLVDPEECISHSEDLIILLPLKEMQLYRDCNFLLPFH